MSKEKTTTEAIIERLLRAIKEDPEAVAAACRYAAISGDAETIADQGDWWQFDGRSTREFVEASSYMMSQVLGWSEEEFEQCWEEHRKAYEERKREDPMNP